MTTEDATYVIAHQNGIMLDRYLAQGVVDRVRSMLQQASTSNQRTAKRKQVQRQQKPEHRTIVIAKEFRATDPVLAQEKLNEARDMAAVYPLLYVLENSVRRVIDNVMTSRHGANWWDSKAPSRLKKTVAARMADEERNSWHQRRGDRPIDYTDLKDLSPLMRKIQNDFVPAIIPNIEWFTQLIDEVYKSRTVVCHMNPLDKNNITAIKVRFNHWQKQIKARKNMIPT